MQKRSKRFDLFQRFVDLGPIFERSLNQKVEIEIETFESKEGSIETKIPIGTEIQVLINFVFLCLFCNDGVDVMEMKWTKAEKEIVVRLCISC